MTTLSEERFFGYEMSDPWLWIPALWVRIGTVFMTGDDRFWRLARKEHNGWWCEPVPSTQVGDESTIRRIRELLLRYRIAVDDLARVRQQADETPESDVLASLAARQADVEYLRDEVIRLCNPDRTPDYVNQPMYGDRNWKPVLIGLCIAFPLVLGAGIGTLLSMDAEPRQEGMVMLRTSLATLAAVSLLVIVVPTWIERNPARAKALARRLLPSGNIIGCAALVLFAIVAGVFLFFLVLALWGPFLLRRLSSLQ